MNESILKCPYCLNIFESTPITLAPCGWVVCSEHLNSNTFDKCLVCSNRHSLDRNKCIPSKNIEIEYLKYKFEKLLKDLENDVTSFKVIKTDYKHFINEYFEKIINQIDLQREKVKLNIDKHFDKILENIKKAKDECENRMPNNTIINEFKIEALEEKIAELSNGIKKLNSSTEFYDLIKEHSISLNDYKKELNNIFDSLVDFKGYELSPISSNIDFDNLFGKLISTYKKDIKFVSGSFDDSIKFWNINNAKCIKTVTKKIRAIYCLKKLNDNQLVSGSKDNFVRIWDTEKDTCLKVLKGHTDLVSCLELLPDNKLASGSYDSTIKIWDLGGQNECISTLEDINNKVYCLYFDETSGNLISGSKNGTIKIWNIKETVCLKTLIGKKSPVSCIKMMQNGNLITSTFSPYIKIWNLESEKCIKNFKAHSNRIWCIDILPYDRLISCSDDKSIKLWDLKDGKCIQTLTGHNGGIGYIKYLKDEKLLSCSDDKTIKLWDLNTNSCIKTFEGHESGVYRLEILS